MNTATIFSIKRFAVHDGPGIRTTVFFKGCPLSCKWCHNPEGLKAERQIALFSHKCVSCGICAQVCPQGAHRLQGTDHWIDRTKCNLCGVCEGECPQKAIQLFGQKVSVSDLMPKLLEDKVFFENSGGGVTLSGGECLLWADFCAELLKELKANGIRTAVDTCGAVPRSAVQKVMDDTDLFLYDVKAMDRDVHIHATGLPNDGILDNLQYIDSMGKNIEIRIPYVPGYNDGEMEKIRDFLQGLKHITAVKVLPYHRLAGSKYESLGFENHLPETVPDAREMERAEAIFAGFNQKAQ